MPPATFGRKGLPAGAVAPRVPVPAPEPPGDPLAQRRAAFVASERARTEEASPAPFSLHDWLPQRTGIPEGRTFATAFALWIGLGLVGAHRFYLGRPVTGAAMALLFIASAILLAMQIYPAFLGLAVDVCWLLADGILIAKVPKAGAAPAA